jgi:hypothetical protein
MAKAIPHNEEIRKSRIRYDEEDDLQKDHVLTQNEEEEADDDDDEDDSIEKLANVNLYSVLNVPKDVGDCRYRIISSTLRSPFYTYSSLK